MFCKIFLSCYEWGWRRQWKLISSAGWVEVPAAPSVDLLFNAHLLVRVCVCVWSAGGMKQMEKGKNAFPRLSRFRLWVTGFKHKHFHWGNNVKVLNLCCKRYRACQAMRHRHQIQQEAAEVPTVETHCTPWKGTAHYCKSRIYFCAHMHPFMCGMRKISHLSW